MSTLVSILIPAYNAERWINECMLSAINQTWPSKEIIVVDDGSSDRTFEVAKRFESRQIKVVRQTNTGACGARNRALSLAQGDYIQWLDADDLLHPEKITRQLAAGGEGRESLTLLTCSWGKFFFRREKAKFVPDSLWKDMGPVDWIMTRFKDNVWMNPAVWLVSRRLTELAGPWDDRVARSGDDDGEYVIRVVAKSDRVRFVRDAVCYYRIGTVGSLNWNMETSEKSLAPLALSLSLAVEHMLSLENSERTRAACLQHLKTFVPYFYPGYEGLLHELDAVAARLGGELNPPKVHWKYYPFEKVLGPKRTKVLISNWRATKLLMQRNLDKYIYDLSRLPIFR